MRYFLQALQFLTIIPVNLGKSEIAVSSGKPAREDLAASLVFFPLVGLLLGGLAWVVLKTCYRLDLGAFAYAIIPVVTLAVLTGGLHLDGLCDTADALGSRRGREEMLGVMRDPRCGALGVTALVCVLLLKVAVIASIPLMYRGKALMLACASSRWPLVFSMYFFPYARSEGKASPFLGSLNGIVLLTAGAVAVACSLAAGARGLLVLATVSCIVALFDMYMKKKLGGITGDTMGASVEIAEIIGLTLAIFIF